MLGLAKRLIEGKRIVIRGETLVYDGPGGPFQGYVCWDEARPGPRPGVIVAHAFGGESQFERDKARALAELGYVGFAIDNYGQGRRANSPDVAKMLMDELDADRPLLARRMHNSLQTLKALPQVDPDRTAAIGFCFGGKCVLDLARIGAEIRGIVSFHGLYDPPPGAVRSQITPSLLILHGWEDPLAPPPSVLQLAEELTESDADWQLLAFGQTGHSFTNPKAQNTQQGLFYSPSSDRRSWAAMQRFLSEIFEEG